MAPHPPPSGLREGLGHQADKQRLVDWVFTRVADRYDLGNDLLSLGWHTRWKRRLVALADLEPTHRVLDLACGTGDLTWMIAGLVPRGQVVGADIHPGMLALARAKGPGDPGGAVPRWVECDAQALPFPDASFDRVICGYAGRGFPDWGRVLAEVHRVLVPGGQFWNLDFARPPQRLWDATVRAWITGYGAALGLALHGHPKTYVYIAESLRLYPGQRWLRERMVDQGFEANLFETRGCLMAYNQGVKHPNGNADG